MDGEKFKLAPMTWAQVEVYREKGNELLKRQETETKPSSDDWLIRTAETVASSLNRASGFPANGKEPDAKAWTVERIKEEMDLALLSALYREVLKISGLVIADGPGGVPAATTLPVSAAA